MAARVENPVRLNGTTTTNHVTMAVKKHSEKVKAWDLNSFMECMLSPATSNDSLAAAPLCDNPADHNSTLNNGSTGSIDSCSFDESNLNNNNSGSKTSELDRDLLNYNLSSSNLPAAAKTSSSDLEQCQRRSHKDLHNSSLSSASSSYSKLNKNDQKLPITTTGVPLAEKSSYINNNNNRNNSSLANIVNSSKSQQPSTSFSSHSALSDSKCLPPASTNCTNNTSSSNVDRCKPNEKLKEEVADYAKIKPSSSSSKQKSVKNSDLSRHKKDNDNFVVDVNKNDQNSSGLSASSSVPQKSPSQTVNCCPSDTTFASVNNQTDSTTNNNNNVNIDPKPATNDNRKRKKLKTIADLNKAKIVDLDEQVSSHGAKQRQDSDGGSLMLNTLSPGSKENCFTSTNGARNNNNGNGSNISHVDKKCKNDNNAYKLSKTDKPLPLAEHHHRRQCSKDFENDDDDFTDFSITHTINLVKSRLSPLLSPIRDFPSLEYKNGQPSLTCRLPLSLVKNVPRFALKRSSNQIPPQKLQSNSNSSNPDDKQPENSILKQPQIFNSSIHNSSNTSHSLPLDLCAKDLDDVPISERRKTVRSTSNSSSGKLVHDTLFDQEQQRLVEKCALDRTATSADGLNGDSVGSQSGLPQTSDLRSGISGVNSNDSAVREMCKNSSDSTPAPNLDSNAKLNRYVNGLKVVKRKAELEAKPLGVDLPKKPKNDSSFLLADAPEKPVQLDCSIKDFKFYMAKAKEVKHQADKDNDRILRVTFYLESICYFFLTGFWMEKTMPKESQSPYHMVKDTLDLLNNVMEKKLPLLFELNERMQALFSHKLEMFTLRLQSLLLCHLCWMRHSVAYMNRRHITDYHKNTVTCKDQNRPSSVHGCSLSSSSAGCSSLLSVAAAAPASCPAAGPSSSLIEFDESDKHPSSSSGTAHNNNNCNGQQTIPNNGTSTSSNITISSNSGPVNNSSTPSPTPSPASSTGSSSHSLPPGLVAIPQHVEVLYKQHFQHTDNLFLAYHHWLAADGKQKQHDCAFFNHLDTICRPLTLTSNVPSTCVYVLTAVNWLRLLYDQHKISVVR